MPRPITIAALCYDKQGKFIDAINDFSKAIQLNPDYAESYTNRGGVYVQLDDFVQARYDFTKAIEINPKMSQAYNNRAIVFYQLKQYTKAWEDLQKTKQLGYAVDPGFIATVKESIEIKKMVDR